MKKQSQTIFIVLCLFFSTGFFFGEIGKSLFQPYLNLLSPFVLLIAGLSLFDRKKESNFILVAIVTSVLIILSYLIAGGGIGSVVGNIGAVMLITVFYRINLSENAIAPIVKYLRLFHVFLIAYFILSPINEDQIGAFNLNSIALQAMINMSYFLLYPSNNKLEQSFWVLSSIALIIACNSRNCMVATLILFVLFYLYRKDKLNVRRMKKWMVWLFALPVIISYLYAFGLKTIDAFEEYNDLSQLYFEKTLFSGREVIWRIAWEQIQKNPSSLFWGIGSHYYVNEDQSYVEMNSNFHSSFLSIIICSGIVVYFCFYYLLRKLYTKNLISSQYALFKNGIYLVFMIVGIFESFLFAGNLSILLYMLLSLPPGEADVKYIPQKYCN